MMDYRQYWRQHGKDATSKDINLRKYTGILPKEKGSEDVRRDGDGHRTQ